ncbi:hypothetical protein ACWEGQ_16700, partial [Streptomyces seoulensis]
LGAALNVSPEAFVEFKSAPPVRVVAPPWPVLGVYGQSQRYGAPHPHPRSQGPGPGAHGYGYPQSGPVAPGAAQGYGSYGAAGAAPAPYPAYNPYRTQP